MRASSWFLVALVCGGLALSALAGAAFARDHARAGGWGMREGVVRANTTLLGILAGAGNDTLVLEVGRERPEADVLRVEASWGRPATAVLARPGYHSALAAVEALRNGSAPADALAVAHGATGLEAEVGVPPAPYPRGDLAAHRVLSVLARDVGREADPSRPGVAREERVDALDAGLRESTSALLVLRFDAPVPEHGEPVTLRVQTFHSDGLRAARWLGLLAVPFGLGAGLAGVLAFRARARGKAEAARDGSAEDEADVGGSVLEGAMRHAGGMEAFLRQVSWASRLLAAGLVLLALVALQAVTLLSTPFLTSRLPLAAAAGVLVFVALGAASVGVAWMLHVRRVRRETTRWRRRFERVRRDQEKFLDEA